MFAMMAGDTEVPETVVRLYLGPDGKHRIQTMIAEELTKVAEVATAAAAAATPTRRRKFRIPPGLGLLTPRGSFWTDDAPAMLSKLRDANKMVDKLSGDIQELEDANNRERRQEHNHQSESMGYILADVMKALRDARKGITLVLGQFREENPEEVVEME